MQLFALLAKLNFFPGYLIVHAVEFAKCVFSSYSVSAFVQK